MAPMAPREILEAAWDDLLETGWKVALPLASQNASTLPVFALRSFGYMFSALLGAFWKGRPKGDRFVAAPGFAKLAEDRKCEKGPTRRSQAEDEAYYSEPEREVPFVRPASISPKRPAGSPNKELILAHERVKEPSFGGGSKFACRATSSSVRTPAVLFLTSFLLRT